MESVGSIWNNYNHGIGVLQ